MLKAVFVLKSLPEHGNKSIVFSFFLFIHLFGIDIFCRVFDIIGGGDIGFSRSNDSCGGFPCGRLCADRAENLPG